MPLLGIIWYMKLSYLGIHHSVSQFLNFLFSFIFRQNISFACHWDCMELSTPMLAEGCHATTAVSPLLETNTTTCLQICWLGQGSPRNRGEMFIIVHQYSYDFLLSDFCKNVLHIFVVDLCFKYLITEEHKLHLNICLHYYTFTSKIICDTVKPVM